MTQERLAELVDLNIRTMEKIDARKINILLTHELKPFLRTVKQIGSARYMEMSEITVVP